MWSLRSFTWVSWWYLPSTDISSRPHFRHFLPSFLCCYLFSKWNIHFFILVFSDPILFSLSFPVFYFPCLLLSIFLLSLSLHILSFLFLSFLSVIYFLSCFLLSFSSDFLRLSSNFSFCFHFFLCLLLSFLAFFACLLLYFPYSSLYPFAYLCVFYYYYYYCCCYYYYYYYYDHHHHHHYYYYWVNTQ